MVKIYQTILIILFFGALSANIYFLLALNSKQNELEVVQQELVKTNNELKDIKEQLSSASNELDKAKEQLNDMNQQLTETEESDHQAMNAKQDQVDSVKRQLAEISQEFFNTQNDNFTLNMQLVDLQDELGMNNNGHKENIKSNGEVENSGCVETGNFNLGREWIVQEGKGDHWDWQAKWLRQEQSNNFDAIWTNQSGGIAHDVIRVDPPYGHYINIYRQGIKGYYHGILSCDMQTVYGTNDWSSPGDHWRARIVR